MHISHNADSKQALIFRIQFAIISRSGVSLKSSQPRTLTKDQQRNTPSSVADAKKIFEITGKGHNVLFEVANPLKHTIAATDPVHGHVSENGDT
jgi:hypothetical protein